MKPSKERLYDALGELIYTVAKADGLIQPEETGKLHELLLAHPWAGSIQWSFDYEKQQKNSLEEVFQKGLETCKEYGPTEEYAFLFEVLDAIAQACHGVDTNEREVIERFKKELKDHFLELDL